MVTAIKEKASPISTHVLLQNGEDLFVTTSNQLACDGKENLKLGMTTIFIAGRKRIRGNIIHLGKSSGWSLCEKEEKSMKENLICFTAWLIELIRIACRNVCTMWTTEKKCVSFVNK